MQPIPLDGPPTATESSSTRGDNQDRHRRRNGIVSLRGALVSRHIGRQLNSSANLDRSHQQQQTYGIEALLSPRLADFAMHSWAQLTLTRRGLAHRLRRCPQVEVNATAAASEASPTGVNSRSTSENLTAAPSGCALPCVFGLRFSEWEVAPHGNLIVTGSIVLGPSQAGPSARYGSADTREAAPLPEPQGRPRPPAGRGC